MSRGWTWSQLVCVFDLWACVKFGGSLMADLWVILSIQTSANIKNQSRWGEEDGRRTRVAVLVAVHDDESQKEYAKMLPRAGITSPGYCSLIRMNAIAIFSVGNNITGAHFPPLKRTLMSYVSDIMSPRFPLCVRLATGCQVQSTQIDTPWDVRSFRPFAASLHFGGCIHANVLIALYLNERI